MIRDKVTENAILISEINSNNIVHKNLINQNK